MEARGLSKLNGGSSKLNGSSFWKSLQRNVKKHMGCFSVVAGRPKDARRVLPIKPAGNAKHMGCFNVVAGRPKDARKALPIKPAGKVTHPHPLLAAGVPATPQKSPAITSND